MVVANGDNKNKQEKQQMIKQMPLNQKIAWIGVLIGITFTLLEVLLIIYW